MKTVFALCVLLTTTGATQAAGYSSLHVFGDSLSTTTDTNNVTIGGSTNYDGDRFCNGPVWVEVLAQRQGLNYNSNFNDSAFGNDSYWLQSEVSNSLAPPDAGTALYAIWVSASDLFVDFFTAGTNETYWPTFWARNISSEMTNYSDAIQTLYDDGVRTLVMPNLVNIFAAPAFSNTNYSYYTPSELAFFHQQVIAYNAAFSAMLNTMRTNLPSLTIFEPDVFSQFNNLLANPTIYGLVNPGIDALGDPTLTNKSLNGPGADYVFWDPLHPTAKVQALLANYVQSVISPARIRGLTLGRGSNELQLVNIPLGENGFVEGSSNLVNWTTETPISATNTTQTFSAPKSGPVWFYRLRF